MYAPDWQTEELAEEWVEESDDDNSESDLSLTKPIAGSFFVTPDRSLGHTEDEPDGAGGAGPSSAVGTFVVREDQPPPILPKTPGKGGIKFGNDMFTPLKLERMFEPPSPPQQQQQATTSSQPLSQLPQAPVPSSSSAPLNPSPLSQCFVPSPDPTTTTRLRKSSAQSIRDSPIIENDGKKDSSEKSVQKEPSDEIMETDIPNVSFNGRKPSMNGQFTFHMPPRPPPDSLHPNSAGPSPMPSSTTPSPFPSAPSGLAGVQSTPKHPNLLDKAIGKSATAGKPSIATPMTDPRLRLFQFQYDTFTREHLSAIVDSIAVNSNSPSSDAFSPLSGAHPQLPGGGPPKSPASPYGAKQLAHARDRAGQAGKALNRLSKVLEDDGSRSHLRSAKRLKLTPETELSEPEPAVSSGLLPHSSASTQRTETTHFLYGQSLHRTESAATNVVASSASAAPAGSRTSGAFTRTNSEASSRTARPSLSTRTASTEFLYGKQQPRADNSDVYGEGEGDGAAIARPPDDLRAQGTLRRDYVSESRSLMSQIKKARDFSTISTVASLRDEGREQEAEPPLSADRKNSETSPVGHGSVILHDTPDTAGEKSVTSNAAANLDPYGPSPPMSMAPSPGTSMANTWNTARPGTLRPASSRPNSALSYRAQAAELIAQIRSGLGSRIVSVATDLSQTTHGEQSIQEKASFRRSSNSGSLRQAERSGRYSEAAYPAGLGHGEDPSVGGPVGAGTGEAPEGSPSGFRPTTGSSPRKRMRTMSVAGHDDEQRLAEGVSRLSIAPAPVVSDPPPMSSNPQVRDGQLRATTPSLVPPTVAVQPPSPAGNHHAPNLATGGAAVPAYPSNSVRARASEDLNRFVSSSTVTSGTGTTLTAGTVDSYVKHAGPKQITHIAPHDVGVPDRVGRMVFDKVMLRWVRDTHEATRLVEAIPERDGEGESDDPFRDIESLTEEEASARHREPQAGGAGPDLEEPEAEDEEERELHSFSFDERSLAVVPALTGVAGEDGSHVMNETMTTDTESDGDEQRDGTDFLEMSEISESMTTDGLHEEPEGLASTFEVDPARFEVVEDGVDGVKQNPIGTWSSSTWPKSGMAMPKVTFTPSPAGRATSTTPVSALKDPSRSRYQTPQSRLVHHRSVSFSDGKRDGPIVDAEEIDASAELTGEELSNLSVDLGNGDVFVPSARSKRIENLMQGLEEDDTSFEDESPSKDTGRPPLPQLQPLSARRPSTSPSKVASTVSARVNGDVSRRVFSQSHGSPLQKSQVNESKANATFLTECSFAVSHDKLVQVITDVQPFEPYWEELSCIDLSRRNVDSVARLKEFLPKLDSLSLNLNQLSYLSGVPKTVRTLTVASNQLTSLTSFNHLLNLENLDISRNNIDSLRQLACLRHLRELRADGNQITSFDGLQRLDGLVKLSVQNNRISEIDFSEYRWNRLEMLNLSHNRVDHITELSTLSALISLNLDNNLLTELECEEPMPRLRILRVSNNKLQVLGCAPFHNVRTLYADNNDLRKLAKAHKLTKLENLSLRNQAGKGLRVDMHDIRDVKRLYLSGNRMDAGFLTEPCYNLIYLELAACRLTSLVGDMARLVPNLRVLNLNYNFLDDEGIAPLRGLSRLKKLTVIGSRLKGTKALVRCVRGMPEVEMLDFRMNPCTLGWYLPLIVRDVPGALQPSERGDRRQDDGEDGPAGTRGGGGRGTTHTTGAAVAASAEEGREKLWNSWQELDAKFRRDLPDESYLGRLAYRGLIMRACSQIRMLDGVQVTGKEKDKAERVLVAIMAKTRNGKPPPELGGSS